ncbi:hypothetical protein EDB80DRAFT_781737 [Ilyonectria destructans]|nr:hypothetical protein EDB80DRAFT_781737 [Ilyonectria destructans]
MCISAYNALNLFHRRRAGASVGEIATNVRYHHDDPRKLFLSDLLEYLQKTKSRALVASRDVPDVREYLAQDLSSESETVTRTEERGHVSVDQAPGAENLARGKCKGAERTITEMPSGISAAYTKELENPVGLPSDKKKGLP